MILELDPRNLLRTVFEDDASTSSTLTVDRTAKQLGGDEDDMSVTSETPTKKSVRFDMNLEEHENKQLYKDEVYQLWYTQYDYKRFRAHTSIMAREVQKAESNNKAPFSYERVLLRTYDVCCRTADESQSSVLTADERKHMNY